MKTKIAIASAFIAASSFSTAEIVINDFLSFEGFVDMSYTLTDQEIGGNSESDNTYAIDQVEISWLFDFDPVTAQIDLAHEGSDGDHGVVEQAFVTYHFDNGGAFTAGRFASMLGFEAFEPTGLYQYSFAYNASEDAPGILGIDGGILPGYDQGVKYTYEGDTSFFGISLVDSVSQGRLGGDDFSGFGIEIAGAFYFENGFSWFAGGRYNDVDDLLLLEDQYVLNTYVTYETGAWIFAAELNYGEASFDTLPDQETLTALLMANFAYSDVASVTGRLSYVDGEQGNVEEDFLKYTLAHGYAFTDNLFLVNEISYVDGETATNLDYSELTFAAEIIFSF
jgi:hypothetical protein